MSLHDRIISMCAPDNVVSHPLCMGGYSVAQQRAAQIAKEADDLMEEMAEALEQCLYVMERGHCQNTREQAQEALNKYKEQANERN